MHALSGILLRAVPTFVLVILLHFYLKYMFFKPLEKVLRARYEATEGAQKMAAESLRKAGERTAEYEAALRAARMEVYRSQEEMHRHLEEGHAVQVQAAREEADAALRKAREQLAAEIQQAKAGLAAQSDVLASQIADAILNRGAVA